MSILHPKAVRRYVLQVLYEAYMADPLEMLSPDDFLCRGQITRHGLAVSMHYLRDDGLAEVMLGYRPPLFVSARITTKGIDLVENRYQFDRRFPPEVTETGDGLESVPALMEQLIAEADLCSLERGSREGLLRDVQYLRGELARPFHLWRHDVVERLLEWIAAPFNGDLEEMPSLPALREILVGLQSRPR
jgi:hypothetical protein